MKLDLRDFIDSREIVWTGCTAVVNFFLVWIFLVLDSWFQLSEVREVLEVLKAFPPVIPVMLLWGRGAESWGGWAQ